MVELVRAGRRPEELSREFEPSAQVIRRKISGGARSEAGREARDAFLGLMKTCYNLGFPFWDDLGDRIKVPDTPAVRSLPDLVRQQAASI